MLLEHRPSAGSEDTQHQVMIKEGTTLHALLGQTVIRVNSHHHQAVKDLAPGLQVSAWSEDQVIEGIEGRDGPWLVGVQWHPERLAGPDAEKLFGGLIAACWEAGERSRQ